MKNHKQQHKNTNLIKHVVCAVEGRNVTLFCNYSRAADSLHWYRQYSGSPPQFLILDYSGVITEAQPPVPGISINHVNKLKQHVDLKISHTVMSDSALYYCALQPTVTGNSATLYKN
uniref:T-cell receptor alpha/delta variable 28.0 n=1 Tax=Pygocentrus nattereri TaxID=42514 RepID=A0AAR2KI16_PYGNA